MILIAIDGDAAAGKSTLAAKLAKEHNCTVVHMDHFFLPPALRTDERLAEPGGNVDYERFKTEVLEPLQAGKPFSYRPFCCQKWDFADEISITPSAITIVEGAYALHPTLAHAYHVKMFVKIDPKEQMRRILARNGEIMAEKFQNIWIPMEKRYQEAFDIEAGCGIIIEG
ncbi:MAG: (d)CMP kinase [Defluviitaleaceae bacterium]|nr:(d)CMP kinase [Defluviitaleaceae bacterium]